MESLKETPVFKFNPNTLQEVRSLFDLDKPGRIEEAIRLLEDWIQKQEHFITKEFDKEVLERLIITNKGLLERCKSKLDKLCTLKTTLPEFFGYCNMREVISTPHYRDTFVDVLMTKLTPDNYRVYLSKIVNVDYITDENKMAYIRSIFLSWEYVARYDYSAGIIAIIDIRGINLMELTSKISLSLSRHFYEIIREGYGIRIKEMHFLTDSKLIESVVNFLKLVVSEKLAQRLYYHTSLHSLYEMVPKEVLCAEYGGNELPLADLRKLWEDTLSSPEHIEYMKTANEFRTDESKRLGEKISDQYLSGSFKTLVID